MNPSCTHCTRFQPTFNKIAFDLQKYPVSFGQINCSKETNLCKMFRVRQYPTLIFIKSGSLYKYPYKRTEEGIKDFILKDYKNELGTDVPNKLPGFFEELITSFSEIKTEINMIYQSGNYWAIGVLSLFVIVSLVMILGIIVFSCSIIWQKLFKKSTGEKPKIN